MTIAATVQWGTIADWVGALGTVAAFGVALMLLRTELHDRQKDRELQQRSQARLVHAWVSHSSHVHNSELPPEGVLDIRLTVRNGSDQPIYEVTAWPLYENGSRIANVHFDQYTVGPLDQVEGGFGQLPADPDRVTGKYQVLVYFTDDAGQRWQRRGGHLSRVVDPDSLPRDPK